MKLLCSSSFQWIINCIKPVFSLCVSKRNSPKMWRRSLAQVAQRCSRSVKIRIILRRWMIRCLPWKASRRSQGTWRSTRPGSVTSAQTHSGTSWRCQVRRKWSHSIVSENFSSRFSSLICFPTLGQYDGRSKPLPEYHAKITGFDERVCTCGWLSSSYTLTDI